MDDGLELEVDGVDIRRFERRSPANRIELQLSLSLVLLFENGMEAHGKPLLAAWNKFLDWQKRDSFTWARLGGGIKNRRMDGPAYRTIESWLNGTRPGGKTCWIDVYGGSFEEGGLPAFAAECRNDDTQVSGADFRVSVSALRESSVDELISHFSDVASSIDFICGTAGYMLHALDWEREALWPVMRPLVTRYEGVEPDNVNDSECSAAMGITGINWLTFVGPRHLERLGGLELLEKASRARPGITPYRVGRGLMLRAGEGPVLGDRNLGPEASNLGPYREVYTLLKPAIFADPMYPFDARSFDGPATVQWLHRFGRP